jgi:predicted anti-sigma-YlaC factor YlaD
MSEDGLPCRAVVELLNDYLEGTLDAPRRAVVEGHLMTCPGCEGYLQQLRLTVELSGTLREQDVPAPVMTALLDAFRGA